RWDQECLLDALCRCMESRESAWLYPNDYVHAEGGAWIIAPRVRMARDRHTRRRRVASRFEATRICRATRTEDPLGSRLKEYTVTTSPVPWNERKYVRVREVAEYTGISLHTIYKAIE